MNTRLPGTIFSRGSFGIGTDAYPKGSFEIKRPGGDWIDLTTDTNAYWRIHNPSSQDALAIGFTDELGNHYWNYLSIMNDGNIGIGTSTPSQRLTVKGGVCLGNC